MKIKIKQYEYEKREVASREVELPDEISYYFQTGTRRSIKIVPRFTTWNKKRYNKEEELYELAVVCLYQSFECRAEKFVLRVKDLETIYYTERSNHQHKDFVISLIDGDFNKRTQEQFECDFNALISNLKSEL